MARAWRIGWASFATLALLAGCAPRVALEVAPEVLSTEWTRGSAAGRAIPEPGSALPSSLGAALGSAELEQLIARAMAANSDVAVAGARVRQSRALLSIARGAMLPAVSANAGMNGVRTSSRPAAGAAREALDFSSAFSLDVDFDTDLFGAARAERRAARDRLTAVEHDRDATRLAVQAEVARAYVQRAAIDTRLGLLAQNIAQARELERIIGVRQRAGDATRVDLGLQTIQVRQLEAERLRLAEALDRTRTALAVLLGEEAPRFQLAPAALDALAIPTLAPVQPGELVARRPDVRAAEARIHAAGGDVAAARAAFLPRITLSASRLFRSAGLSGPLDNTLDLAAGLLAPIFDRARLRGDLELAAGRQAESVQRYRRALLVSLSEAEDALAAVESSRVREALLRQIVQEARETARLARLQYVEGEANLRWVLSAEQWLVEAEDARALAVQERIEAAINLYSALGGAPAGTPEMRSPRS